MTTHCALLPGLSGYSCEKKNALLVEIVRRVDDSTLMSTHTNLVRTKQHIDSEAPPVVVTTEIIDYTADVVRRPPQVHSLYGRVWCRSNVSGARNSRNIPVWVSVVLVKRGIQQYGPRSVGFSRFDYLPRAKDTAA